MHIHKKDSWISRASFTEIKVNSVLHCSDCSGFHRDLTSRPSIDRNFHQPSVRCRISNHLKIILAYFRLEVKMTPFFGLNKQME